MPTVTIINGFRFFFYSNDHEPVHIHIEKDGKTAKYCLTPLGLVKSTGFNASDLRKIGTLIDDNIELFKQRWNEYFNS